MSFRIGIPNVLNLFGNLFVSQEQLGQVTFKDKEHLNQF